MQVLMVLAHPEPASFCGALCRRAAASLRAAGHEVRLHDLYASGFDPVLDRAAWQRYGSAPERNREGLEAAVAQLLWAEALVLIYPTWWSGPPAILKGWLDRVWLPGVAFLPPQGKGHIRPLLHRIRVLGGIVTYGAPWWHVRLISGDPGRRMVLRGLRPLCARRCRTFWLPHYDTDRIGTPRRRQFLERLGDRLPALFGERRTAPASA